MKKKILYTFIIIVVIAIAAGAYGYSIISTGFNIDKTVYIYIDENRDYDALLKELKDSAKVKNISNFELLASVMDYKGNLKTGRYAVKPDMNILDLMRHLRSGHQTPLNLKFNNIRTKEDFAERISNQLMLGNCLLYTSDAADE